MAKANSPRSERSIRITMANLPRFMALAKNHVQLIDVKPTDNVTYILATLMATDQELYQLGVSMATA